MGEGLAEARTEAKLNCPFRPGLAAGRGQGGREKKPPYPLPRGDEGEP